jgi:hypothetical protein
MKVSARRFAAALLSLSALALLQATAPLAQAPGTPPGGQTSGGPPVATAPEEPKNLKVLPKTMTRREVIGVMRSISLALGVRCTECHVSKVPGSERFEDLDFAKDEKPDKETARAMMKMVASINEQIGKMGLKEPVEVRCVTCHHGVKKPETLVALMQRELDRGGAEGAIAAYRKLRDQYYGSAAYDFSPFSLNETANNWAQSKQDLDGAIQLVQLNLEFNPKHAESYVAMGRWQVAKGDKAGAIASFEKALELNPNHGGAKEQLEKAKAMP